MNRMTPEHRTNIEKSLGMTIGEWLQQPEIKELSNLDVAIRLNPVVGWTLAANTICRWRKKERPGAGVIHDSDSRNRRGETIEVFPIRGRDFLSASWR